MQNIRNVTQLYHLVGWCWNYHEVGQGKGAPGGATCKEQQIVSWPLDVMFQTPHSFSVLFRIHVHTLPCLRFNTVNKTSPRARGIHIFYEKSYDEICKLFL